MVYVACFIAGIFVGALAFVVAVVRGCSNPLDVMDVERL